MKIRNSKYLLAGLFVCLIFLLAGNAYGEMLNVSRDVPDSVNAGETFDVNLKLSVATTGITGLIIKESVPACLEFVSATDDGKFDSNASEIRWILFGNNVRTQTITYKLNASERCADIGFKGIYTTLEGGANNISGDKTAAIKRGILGIDPLLLLGIGIVVLIVIAAVIMRGKKKK